MPPISMMPYGPLPPTIEIEFFGCSICMWLISLMPVAPIVM